MRCIISQITMPSVSRRSWSSLILSALSAHRSIDELEVQLFLRRTASFPAPGVRRQPCGEEIPVRRPNQIRESLSAETDVEFALQTASRSEHGPRTAERIERIRQAAWRHGKFSIAAYARGSRAVWELPGCSRSGAAMRAEDD